MSYVKREITFPSVREGETLHAVIYEPTECRAKAILQISHGMIDHIGRYETLAAALTSRGFIVAGNDHLGHGESVKSDSEFGFFADRDGYSLVIDDLHGMNVKLSEAYPELPIVLMGHSMGSFLARLYAVRYGDTIDGLIIHGTGGKNPAIPFGKLVVDALKLFRGKMHRSKFVKSLAEGGYNKTFDKSEGEGAWLTRDGAMVADRPADKRTNFIFTVSGYRDLFEMLDRCNRKIWYEAFPDDLKTLVISGAEDPVGNFGKGVREVYDGLKSAGADVSLKLYEGARHELFNETNREEVFRDISEFIEGCIVE